MERDFEFQPLIAGGGFSPSMSVEEAYLNGVYNGIMSFQSMLNAANEPPSVYNAYYDVQLQNEPSLYQLPLPVPAYPPLSTYSFHGEEFPAPLEISHDAQNLKMPKIETLNVGDLQTEPFNFFSETATFPSHDSLTESEPNSVMQNLQSGTTCLSRTKNARNPYSAACSAAARRRRQTISEKVRCLEKLLPMDKKMDMGTMLEEAYKYVKFLEAQVSVLQSMPVDAATPSSNDNHAASSLSTSPSVSVSAEALRKLNRQQLLEIMVNSRAGQTLLTSKGCCVYSVEQLNYLDKIAQTKLLFPCYPI